ncbi:MAG TPA: hypothetical protein VKV16_07820 [Solirubrobacteraceae bacterium]|nr:hypothetical protein [Solirubrobacteraceae bacterium]
MADHKERDVRVSLAPLTGEEALRALLAVDPESEPVEEDTDETEESEAVAEGGSSAADDRCPTTGWGANGVQRCIHKAGHLGSCQFVPGQ